MPGMKGINFDHDFCYIILIIFFPLILEVKGKGEKNNQSRGQNSFLSDQSFFS
jgi:hypothetical protein